MAKTHGWEGLIAKRLHSQYKPGRRTNDWRKLKIVHQQEFVVGGWTEPRSSRQYFGALLLGVYDRHRLRYVGHSGSGFTDTELARVWKLLKPLETRTCPFDPPPAANEQPHWVRPSLVVEVKFSEWTDDNKLRHPIYLGLRDDKRPEQVVRESVSLEASPSATHEMSADRPRARAARASSASKTKVRVESSPRSTLRPASTSRAGKRAHPDRAMVDDLVSQLDEIQARGGDGLLRLPGDDTLRVTNLKKVFWPALRLTKGDLFRFYARVSPYLLPVVADRPLVMKRFPNGVKGKAFYQQRAPDDVPAGVRVEVLEDDHEVPSRLVGGSLKTLLYMTQMAAISQDPWFSRVQSPRMADHVALDLDPMPGVTFKQVLDVARWVHDELRELRVEGYPKTSGSDGLHVFIPLPRNTPYEAGLIFCQIIATMVAKKHPKQATVERTVSARGQKVYVDYLQNIHGKTLACAYSARASDFAGASTPLTWEEVHKGIAREDLTIVTLPDRLERVGDLWAPLLASKGVKLRAVEKYLAAGQPL